MHLPPNLCIRHSLLELALISNEHHYDSVYIAPLARIPFAVEQKPACLETPTGPAEAIACRGPGERFRCSSSILTPALKCRERNVSDWRLPGGLVNWPH